MPSIAIARRVLTLEGHHATRVEVENFIPATCERPLLYGVDFHHRSI
jgi:hypothetical protein